MHEVQRAQPRTSGASPAGLTNFEMLTAAAYLTFSRSVDVAVVEVGVGGLRDATNIIMQPAVSVITSVAMDHSDLLGETVADIAKEKAGILKPGCPAVIGTVDAVAAEQISEYAHHIGAGELIWSSPATATTAPKTGESHHHHPHKWALHGGLKYPLMLGGDYQLSNSAVAIDALHLLRTQAVATAGQTGAGITGNIACSDGAIAAGMRSVQWPGRLQWSKWPVAVATNGDSDCTSIRKGTRDSKAPGPVLLDGAHNPAAAEALSRYVDEEVRQGIAEPKPIPLTGNRHPIVWVIALSKGKDARSLLSTLLRDGDSVVFVPFSVGLCFAQTRLPGSFQSRTSFLQT